MNTVAYLRPQTISDVTQYLTRFPHAQLLAGGQSLLSAWRLGLCNPSHFVDLQEVPDLNHIRIEGDILWVGAMCTHAQIAQNRVVISQFPMLSDLAGAIADAQIRNVGTIGGSLANNDPAACWPAGVLAMQAEIVTNLRVIPADAFFLGLFATALKKGEWILGLRFPRIALAKYLKYEQAASRFALVGVAVVRNLKGTVRVAVTGLGQGVVRWRDAEQILSKTWQTHALKNLQFNISNVLSDLHASAEYRAHLVRVLCQRAVAISADEVVAKVKPKATERFKKWFTRIFER